MRGLSFVEWPVFVGWPFRAVGEGGGVLELVVVVVEVSPCSSTSFFIALTYRNNENN
jgi:hypothetical protein